MRQDIERIFDDSAAVAKESRAKLAGRVAQAVELIVQAYRSGRGVLAFGNGGSASDAQHLIGELAGRFLKERRPFKAQALGCNIALLTAVANDYGYAAVFARELEALGVSGDVAIGISTSGDSANVVAALKKARELGLKTVAMTGEGGGQCAALADVLLDVPSRATPRIQESHAIIYHTICELVESALSGGESRAH